MGIYFHDRKIFSNISISKKIYFKDKHCLHRWHVMLLQTFFTKTDIRWHSICLCEHEWLPWTYFTCFCDYTYYPHPWIWDVTSILYINLLRLLSNTWTQNLAMCDAKSPTYPPLPQSCRPVRIWRPFSQPEAGTLSLQASDQHHVTEEEPSTTDHVLISIVLCK